MEDPIKFELTEQELKSLWIVLQDHLDAEENWTPHHIDSVDISERLRHLIVSVDPEFFKTIPDFAVSYFLNKN